MTRLAVDTLVFIRAIFYAPGNPASVLLMQVIESGVAQLVISEPTAIEILSIIAAHGIEAGLGRRTIDPVTRRVMRILLHGERVDVVPQFTGCPDSDDDKYVDLAVQGKADYLVTEDDHLYALENPPVPVTTPWKLLYQLRRDLRPKGPGRSTR